MLTSGRRLEDCGLGRRVRLYIAGAGAAARGQRGGTKDPLTHWAPPLKKKQWNSLSCDRLAISRGEFKVKDFQASGGLSSFDYVFFSSSFLLAIGAQNIEISTYMHE